jgi:hypothetical protein
MTARASSRETPSQAFRAQASLLRIDGERFITSPREKQSTIYPVLTTLSNGFATCSISAPSARASRGELDIQATRELDPLGSVVVLEDTNADGKLDERTVFADGLVLARALKVLDRGVLVGEPPNLWLMKDANNDLKMDSKELVTDAYGRREANVEHNANSLLGARQRHLHR